MSEWWLKGLSYYVVYFNCLTTRCISCSDGEQTLAGRNEGLSLDLPSKTLPRQQPNASLANTENFQIEETLPVK